MVLKRERFQTSYSGIKHKNPGIDEVSMVLKCELL